MCRRGKLWAIASRRPSMAPWYNYGHNGLKLMATQLDARQLGRRIRQLRKQQQLSLHGLGQRAEVDASWIMRLERGEYASPDPRRLVQLAEALGVDVTDLF